MLILFSSGCVVYLEENKSSESTKIDSTEHSKWYFEKNK